MLNVDTGNSPQKPDNPRELRATWRLTVMAVVGFLIFLLLFIAVDRLIDATVPRDGTIDERPPQSWSRGGHVGPARTSMAAAEMPGLA